MKNLDQIRAAKALDAVNRNGSKITKQTVSKLPAMIISNGLLAAAAFADEPKKEGVPKRPEMQDAMNQVAQHLKNPVLGINILTGCDSAKKLIEKLTAANTTSSDLQRATGEALAFLSYLKRFAVKDSKEDNA
jgi:CRISPR type III-B/RAMP module-associated protein Cmr5